MPIARAIPSSPRRSAASITKMRKMSRIPAAIENVPNVVKKAMNALPASSAAAIASCFERARLEAEGRPTGSERCDDLIREPDGGHLRWPRFETRIRLDQSVPVEQRCACASDSRSAASAVRRRRSGRRRGRARRALRPRRRATRSPAPTCSSSAAFRFRKTSPGPRSSSVTFRPPTLRIGAKPSIRVGVGREEDDARLVLPLRRRLEGDLLDDRASHAVGQVLAHEARVNLRTVACGK